MINRNGVHLPDTTYGGNPIDWNCSSDSDDSPQRLKAENAKLREQMERLVTLLRVDCDIDASWDGLRRFWSIGLTENGCLMRDRACKAEAENAKLRKLCADMLWTIKHAHGYFKNDTHEMLMTYMQGRDGKPTYVAYSLTCDEEEYERRMAELGIEVDDG